MDETIKDFDSFYAIKLQPLIANLKQEAGAAGNWGIIAPVTCFISILLFAGYQMKYIRGNGGCVIFICIAAIIASIYFYSKKNNRYTKDFKETVIQEIITYLSPGIIYKPDEVIETGYYKYSGLFRKGFDYYEGNDYMEGVYKGVPFRCSELHTQYEKLNGITSRMKTIFKGLFFVAEIDKIFTAGTYIWCANKDQAGNTVTHERYHLTKQAHLYKIKLENGVAEFENTFSVYSTDPAEAGSILTKAMTERLVKFKKQINRAIEISFVAGRCYVAIPIKEDLLEPSGFDTDGPEEVKNYFFTVLLILSIINQLELNNLQ